MGCAAFAPLQKSRSSIPVVVRVSSSNDYQNSVGINHGAFKQTLKQGFSGSIPCPSLRKLTLIAYIGAPFSYASIGRFQSGGNDRACVLPLTAVQARRGRLLKVCGSLLPNRFGKIVLCYGRRSWQILEVSKGL